MWLSIVSSAPHYPGNNQDLVGTYQGIYRILCPHRPGTYTGLKWEDTLVKRGGNILPQNVCICQTLTKDTPG